MFFFLGCIVGYFVNKYDDVVVDTIRKWWAKLEKQLGIGDNNTNQGDK